MRVKSFVLLLLPLCFSEAFYGQTSFPYDSAWKKIDVLIQKKSLPQSALTEVNKVYAAAKKDRREDQWIKAAIYRIQLTENAQDEAGFRLGAWDSAITGAPARVKAVLLSAEAGALAARGQQLPYRRGRQTNVVGDSSTDLSSWPAERFDSLVSALYLNSLEEKQSLRQTSLKGYEPILLRGNARQLRPTLYDLLVSRALDYFSDPGRYEYQTNSSYQPETDSALFGPADRFRKLAFDGAGNTKRVRALRLYQDILSFHAPDADASAEVDADINRIQFVKGFSAVPAKERLYSGALEKITSMFPGLPAAAQAGYLQANCFVQSASLFDPLKDTTHRFDLVLAKAIAERYASSPDSSEGRSNCINLIRRLDIQTLELETEKVNLPGLPFRALVGYKNAERLYGRTIRIDDATRQSLSNGYYNDESWRKLAHFPPDRKFVFTLPATKDFQLHRVEIPIDPLTKGEYALFISTDSTFSTSSGLAVSYFFISSIAFAWRGGDCFVADRSSGKPLAGVKVIAFHDVYGNGTGRNNRAQDGRFITDAGGRFRAVFPEPDRYSQRTYIFSLGDDRLVAPNRYVNSYTNNIEDEEADDEKEYDERWRQASLFTDRGIYRPGQPVFVKSLMMTRDFRSRAYRTAAAVHSKLYLVDVNQQQIDSLAYVSNPFGSFSCSFHLPSAVLTGSFGITDSLTGSTVNFLVEEYKRPRFFVDIDTPTGPLHLNDSVRFEGMAKAYAGNAVDGARVSYRVFREARFPYPWYFRNLPSSQEQQLASGTVVTDAQGKFSIPFRALPDVSLSSSTKPIFKYRVLAEVADGNGEVHEGAGSVTLSYQSFQIVSWLPKETVFPADSLIRFPLTTNDLNGRFQSHKLTVALYSLEMPDRLIRERYWEQPDQYLIDQPSYVRLFPNDAYADETDKSTWKTRELIVAREAETRADGTFPLTVNNARRLSGWYLVVFSGPDKNGDTIVDKRWIALGNDKSRKPLYPEYMVRTGGVQEAEPGESVLISAGSAADVFVSRVVLSRSDSIRDLSTFILNNDIKPLPVMITEADRGGFEIEDIFIKDNRIYVNRQSVFVPWSNKVLNVQFKTWKDRTLPGSKETWSLHVEGPGKDKSIAEILSAMYDASLDAFTPFSWQPPDIYPLFASNGDDWSGSGNFGIAEAFRRSKQPVSDNFQMQYDVLFYSYVLNRFGGPAARPMMLNGKAAGIVVGNSMDEVRVSGYGVSRKKKETAGNVSPEDEEVKDSASVSPSGTPESAVAIRKNFNETAFFFPDLHTDADGNVSFSFTMPEALTKWKWMVFAHTKDLAFGLGEKSVITQKELMLLPNMPRFLRQGDSLQVPVKISNLSNKELSGKVRLDWRDAGDSGERNTAFGNQQPEQSFSVPAGQSRTYFFSTTVSAAQQEPVYYRLVATTGGTAQLSDGEEGILPVLSNRRLVTETLPIRLNKEISKSFHWDKLLHSDSSKSLQQHSLTVEYTTRPAWYAVQSLPYLMEFPYECAEQTFDRYYANALGAQIVNRVPGMSGVLAAWKTGDSSALQSNLEKNEELKNVLLKETPWVVEAKTETAQKQQLAKLLDNEKLAAEMKKALGKLQALQSGGGGFPWFAGGRDDRYITQYIVTGIGHLLKLKALPVSDQPAYVAVVKKALVFLDAGIKRDYDNRPKHSADNLGPLQIQYLYMRSFFRDIDVPGPAFFALNYYRLQAQQHWTDQNMYLRGMLALFLNRNGDKKTAQDILKSLRENAIGNDNDGTYWKRSGPGYYWQESQVETQSLLIETFAELGADGETDSMKWWLLQQKQTTHWNSTKSTADACYALLMNGSDWLGNQQQVTIKLGNETINSSSEKTEAGTGYFKKIIPAENIVPAMGHITVSINPAGEKAVPSFGAAYWQYFEEPGNITAAGNALSVTKTLFVQKNTDKGVVGEALPAGSALRVGDKLLLRFIIKTDRDLSYVQLKDERAACLEPVQVLSGYQWQGDLGYYQAPGDESSSFFFDYLPKGTHVVEYPVYVTTSGVFSGGIATLQTMYAPEFSGHTAGSRLQITEK